MFKNMTISRDLVTVDPKTKVIEAAEEMDDNDVGSVLVVEDGKVKGIVTDRDIVVRCIAADRDVHETTVDEILTESPEVVSEEDGVNDAIKKMKAAGIRRLPVVDKNGKPVGIVSFGDLVSMLAKQLDALTRTTTSRADRFSGFEATEAEIKLENEEKTAA